VYKQDWTYSFVYVNGVPDGVKPCHRVVRRARGR